MYAEVCDYMSHNVAGPARGPTPVLTFRMRTPGLSEIAISEPT